MRGKAWNATLINIHQNTNNSSILAKMDKAAIDTSTGGS